MKKKNKKKKRKKKKNHKKKNKKMKKEEKRIRRAWEDQQKILAAGGRVDPAEKAKLDTIYYEQHMMESARKAHIRALLILWLFWIWVDLSVLVL